MKKFISFLFVIAIIFYGCSGKNNYSTPEYAIEANARFMNEEDFDGVMSIIHPESPSYPTTGTLVKKNF